jgi:hypothetical protein
MRHLKWSTTVVWLGMSALLFTLAMLLQVTGMAVKWLMIAAAMVLLVVAFVGKKGV